MARVAPDDLADENLNLAQPLSYLDTAQRLLTEKEPTLHHYPIGYWSRSA